MSKKTEESLPLNLCDCKDLNNNKKQNVMAFLEEFEADRVAALEMLGKMTTQPATGYAKWLRAVLNKLELSDRLDILRFVIENSELPPKYTMRYDIELVTLVEELKQDECQNLCTTLSQLTKLGKIASSYFPYPKTGYSTKCQITLERAMLGYIQAVVDSNSKPVLKTATLNKLAEEIGSDRSYSGNNAAFLVLSILDVGKSKIVKLSNVESYTCTKAKATVVKKIREAKQKIANQHNQQQRSHKQS